MDRERAAWLQFQKHLGLETPFQFVAVWQEVLAELDAKQKVAGFWIFEPMLYGCCYRARQHVVQRRPHPSTISPKQAGDIMWGLIMRRSTEKGVAMRTHEGRIWSDLATVRAPVLEFRDEAQAVCDSSRMESGLTAVSRDTHDG